MTNSTAYTVSGGASFGFSSHQPQSETVSSLHKAAYPELACLAWYGNQDGLEILLDRMNKDADSLCKQEEINEAANFLKSQQFGDSAERVKYFSQINDLDEGEQALSIESVRGFISFITRFKDLGEPSLGLYPQGTLGVSWHISNDKHLLLEFLDANTVAYAMFTPGEDPQKPQQLHGRGSVGDVIETLQKQEINQW